MCVFKYGADKPGYINASYNPRQPYDPTGQALQNAGEEGNVYVYA